MKFPTPSGISIALFCLLQNVVQDPAELFNSVWFGSNPAKSILLKIRHDRIIGISAGYNGGYLRINAQQLLDSLLAAHPTGDGQVHDDRIKWPTGFERRPGNAQWFQHRRKRSRLHIPIPSISFR